MTRALFPPPLVCIDYDTQHMMEAYALADHTLHSGGSGTFEFYRWGKWREIRVENGVLTARVVKRNHGHH